MPKLRVYGWQGWRVGAHPDKPWNNTTREIVAARSKAEVGRLAGERRLFNLTETGNAEELSQALAEPGVIFWRGIDVRDGEWKRA